MKLAVAVLLWLSLTTAVSASPVSDEIEVRTFEVILSHDDTERDTVGELKYRGGLDIRSTDRRFGGLSGLDISPDGRRLIAVTDRGD